MTRVRMSALVVANDQECCIGLTGATISRAGLCGGAAGIGQTRPRYRTAPAWLLSARRSREART
jgi:hypothetical protein